MPAARGLSGEIAKLLGRPESDGWIFTTRFQEAGIIPIGRGGRKGAGAPNANAQAAVLLLLAIASGLSAPQAVQEAVTWYLLPLLSANGCCLPNLPLIFGETLSSIVNRYRAAATFPCLLGQIKIGGRRHSDKTWLAFGRIRAQSVNLHADNQFGAVVEYGKVFDTPCPIEEGRNLALSGGVLSKLASLLGPSTNVQQEGNSESPRINWGAALAMHGRARSSPVTLPVRLRACEKEDWNISR